MIVTIAILLAVIKFSRKKMNLITVTLIASTLMLASILAIDSENWNVTKQKTVDLETVYKTGGAGIEDEIIGYTRKQIAEWEDSLYFSGMEKNRDGSETWHYGMGQGIIIVHYNAFDVVTDIDILKTE